MPNISNIAGNSRRSLAPLVTFEIVFKLLYAVVLAPLGAWGLTVSTYLADRPSLSNDQLLDFVQSPWGFFTAIVGAGLVFAVMMAEQAGILLIAFGESWGQHSLVGYLVLVVRNFTGIVRLGLIQVALWALVAAPFALIAAVVYWALLSGHDINYYLDAKPGEFWIAAAIGVVLAVVGGGLLAWLYLRWALALPVLLFEGISGLPALRRSSQLMRSRYGRLAAWLVGWHVVLSVVALAVGIGFRELAEGALGWAGEDPGRLVPVATLLLTFRWLLACGASFLSVVVSCFVIMAFYQEAVPNSAAIWSAAAERMDLEGGGPAASRIVSRRFWLALVLAAVVSWGVSLVVVESLDFVDNVAVTAHRGSSQRAPENTLAAIRAAIDDGADFVEIDVQTTTDGGVVVIHDEDLMRLAGIDRRVRDMRFEEFQSVDVGSSFRAEFAGERVPALAEAIETARGQIKLYIELKFGAAGDPLADKVVELVHQHEFAEQCVIVSLDYGRLQRVREIDPTLGLGYLVYSRVGDITRLDIDFLSLNQKLVTEDLIASIQARDQGVHAWTVDQPRPMVDLIELGVDNIITNDPAMLVDILRDRAELTDIERVILWLRHTL
jgi:glycerophosphoryl diester phosphodiesterase